MAKKKAAAPKRATKKKPAKKRPGRKSKAESGALSAPRTSRRRAKGEWEPSPRQLEIYADLHRGDLTQGDVAKKYGLTRQRVGAIKDQINKYLVPIYMDSIRELRCEHTQRLMHIYQEAMAAWEASKKPGIVEESGVSVKGPYDKTTTRHQTGDSSYLREARAALSEIRRVWGADTPIEVKHTGEIRVAGMPIEDAIAAKQAQLAAIADMHRAQAGSTGEIIDVEVEGESK